MSFSTLSRWRLGLIVGLLFTTELALAAPTFAIVGTESGEGAIVLDPDRETYKRNNIVSVTAVPEAGWSFDHWEGDLSGSENPTTIRIKSDVEFTAVFVEETGEPPEPPGNAGPLPEQGLVVGYFTQWGIYRRGYLPKHLISSGTLPRTHVINYAFIGISDGLECESLDPFADYEKRYDAGESVDQAADSTTQSLRGNFNQLRKLKQMFPDLRVVLSIGGWTESARFSDVALTEQSRSKFVASCISRLLTGEVTAGVSVAGLFDGLDIDWEYPGRCGATCNYREEDPANFAALMAEFRNQLDAAEAAMGREYLLTIAAPAGAEYYGVLDLSGLHPHLDWINAMAYDFHGSWEGVGPTNHHSPLYQSGCDGPEGDWGEKAVDYYLGAGVPASKLLLGVAFYGRGWRGVAPVNDGFCQAARGIPRGKYEKGIEDFKVLNASGDPDFYAAGTHWTFDGSEFWSYDDATSMMEKTSFVRNKSLRGVMYWEASGDTNDGVLIRAIASGLEQGANP